MAKWNDADISNFLSLYEEHEGLWNPRSEAYRNNKARSAAVQNIITEMKVDMSEAELKTKIKNVRTTYHREVTKINNSKKDGLAAEDFYKPSLSWFHQADRFLRAVIEGRPCINNTTPTLDLDEYTLTQESAEDNNISLPSTSCDTYEASGVTWAEDKAIQSDLPEKACVPIQSSSNDMFDVFGVTVAYKLREMSRLQRLYCENVINQALFKGSLNQLTPNSIIFEPSDEKHHLSSPCFNILPH